MNDVEWVASKINTHTCNNCNGLCDKDMAASCLRMARITAKSIVDGEIERGMVLLDKDQSPPSMICHGQDPVSVHSATIALMKHYGFRRVIDIKETNNERRTVPDNPSPGQETT